MRIAELQQREDFLLVLADTLAAGWSAQHGRAFRVSADPGGDGQEWFVQPVLSVVGTRHISRGARRFAADGFRFTQVRWRAPLQWLLGTALASRHGFRLTSRRLLRVAPALPGAEALLILPGNRRVRVFDFSSQTSRVLMKAGYDPGPNLVELAVRGSGASGPYVQIANRASGGDWFEEPLVAGFALARCPPWRNRRVLELRALALLGQWLGRSTVEEAAAPHLERLEEEAARGGWELEQRTARPVAARFREVAARLLATADRNGRCETALTHGDFQPGNVLIERSGGAVHLTDWEFSARRIREYDFLVWGLRSRSARGFAQRVLAYLATGNLGAAGRHLGDSGDRPRRGAVLSRFLLEELSWQVADNLSGRRRTLSASALSALAAAEALAAAVER